MTRTARINGSWLTTRPDGQMMTLFVLVPRFVVIAFALRDCNGSSEQKKTGFSLQINISVKTGVRFPKY